MAVRVGHLQFLDSMQFAKSSLAELAKTMDEDDFVETKKLFNIPGKIDPPLCTTFIQIGNSNLMTG